MIKTYRFSEVLEIVRVIIGAIAKELACEEKSVRCKCDTCTYVMAGIAKIIHDLEVTGKGAELANAFLEKMRIAEQAELEREGKSDENI
ncbi:MAG: hypothetical protein ACXABY_20150 [Candidatus Thorarchaeota archaeon]|jgi:hypothetical protein